MPSRASLYLFVFICIGRMWEEEGSGSGPRERWVTFFSVIFSRLPCTLLFRRRRRRGRREGARLMSSIGAGPPRLTTSPQEHQTCVCAVVLKHCWSSLPLIIVLLFQNKMNRTSIRAFVFFLKKKTTSVLSSSCCFSCPSAGSLSALILAGIPISPVLSSWSCRLGSEEHGRRCSKCHWAWKSSKPLIQLPMLL